MKKRIDNRFACAGELILQPALTPLEAAVLPAQERPRLGVLSMIRTAWEAGEGQRAKI